MSHNIKFIKEKRDLAPDFDQAAEDIEVEEPAVPPTMVPPVELSKSALDKRLRRVMKPRANGVCRVPEEIRSQWEDLTTRDMICSLFEKCGYDPDWVC